MMRYRLFIILACALFLTSGQVQAQKKGKAKKPAPALPTFPSRDEVFGKEVKFRPLGAFDRHQLEYNYTMLPAPDFTGHQLKRNTSRPQVVLKPVSSEPDESYSDEYWAEKYDIALVESRVEETPLYKFGFRLCYTANGYHVYTLGTTYGDTSKMVITDENDTQVLAAYDFENFRFSPKTTLMGNDQKIQFAIIEGNILFVAHGCNTYSDGTGYQTGYISAIDLNTDEIIWTTRPMTCNSEFAISGNSIICGYGFSHEPDYLYIVDKYSGQRVKRTSLRTAAENIAVKGKKVYVHCYNYNYVFSF